MTFSFFHVALICFSYLSVLFLVAYATEKGFVSDRIVSHPIVYVLSLGIFASAWSYYGVIDLARQFGYGALAYYIGTGVLFLFAPIALKPLIQIARRFQINSMADLLTFRYDSHGVGGIVTLCMLLAMAPLMAVQIQAVADTIHILTSQSESKLTTHTLELGAREAMALVYCVVIACFAMLFGSNRSHHKGLITAMAFESLVKLSGLFAMGLYAVFVVFGGFGGLDSWLLENPEHMNNLYSTEKSGSSHALLLVFIATAVAMPHIFHITVVENPIKHATKTISWAFPLFLLLMAVPVFPILWAGVKLHHTLPTEYFPLAIPMATDSPLFAIVSFVAGLSAATGAMVAISLSISTMIMNHWILPTIPLGHKQEIYGLLVRTRRIVIIGVIVASYLFYTVLKNRFSLTDLALAAFIATLQFLPGVISVAHWKQGNRRGLLCGLFFGMSTWFCGLLVPMIAGIGSYPIPGSNGTILLGIDHWADITILSLGMNTVAFACISWLTKPSDDELYAAELCSEDELSHPVRMVMDVRSPGDIGERLGKRIGLSTAQLEIERALKQLDMSPNERRPYALRRLRDEIEANLSGLLGISMASEIMDTYIPLKVPEVEGAPDINLIESRIGQYREHLTGLAADLNNLRLYHRRTLEELPLAACSVGKDMEVLMWNSAMEHLTGIESESVTGSRLEDVLEPWGKLLLEFSRSSQAHFYKQPVDLTDQPHWISLHKATIPSSLTHKVDGQVILLEDVTEMQRLEKELMHSERLASVGRLAAGVAHEIGNPVTGIACLAQNLKYETEESEIQETAAQILSQTHRVTRIVQSLVSFSHSGEKKSEEFRNLDLRECAQEAINLLALQIEKHSVNYVNSLTENFCVVGDCQRLIQVFVNLLSNARDASPDGTLIEIDGEISNGMATVTVTDEGPGIPPEIQDRILEPFFTTKEPGEGTGLGLAMVYSIIEDHKGQLDIVSPTDLRLNKGTRFVIKVPAALASTASSGNTRESTST